MDRRAVSLFIEAVAASGNWQAALQALHTAGIDLQTAHCTSMDANNDNNNNNSNNNLQCLSCRDVLLLATLFKDASQWGLLRSLTLMPHHRLTTHDAHGDGHAHEGSDLVQARRLAFTALFHQEEESNNNNNNNNKRHDVWELALAVARSDFMFLGSTQSSLRRGEDCVPPKEETPGPNTNNNNNNNNTITTSSTSSRSVTGEMLAMCLEIIQPRIPLDAQRNAALLEWSRLATASPATDATAAGTEVGGCDDVQALHRLMQGPRRRETWAHALRHFMRLADGSSSSGITGRDGYIPEEAVRAVLMCLARQAKETLVLHITDRHILEAEGQGCGTTVKHSQELFQTMAEVADLLSSKALCTKLLSYTKAATAAGVVDGGGDATGVCLLPTPSTLALVLRTLQRVGDHEAVLLWWDSWAATSNSSTNIVTTTQSADIATNGNCSSWLDVTQNLNIRSHVAVSMVVRKPSAWADALRTLDEERSITASAGRVALYKLRLLRTARQWEAALTVLREYMDHQNHNRKNSGNAREIQLLFSRQERVEQWVPRRIILQLDQEGMLTTAASSNAWMSHQKKKGGK